MGIINQLSPGIVVNEIDLTTIVPGVSTSVGAFVGQFNWGPANIPILIDTEETLVSTFSVPTQRASNSFVGTSFFSCVNFLAYSAQMWVVRALSDSSKNATSNANSSILVANKSVFDASYLYATTANTYGPFIAKYPGAIGNGIKVDLCANTSMFNSWAYKNYFDNAPGTSDYALQHGSANDEMHIVVIDSNGVFSGTNGTVIEKFPFVSKAADAISIDGQNNFYEQVLYRNSNYVYAIDPVDYPNANNTWGNTAVAVTSFYSPPTNYTITLTGGSDGNAIAAANLISGWDNFNNKDVYDVSLLITGSSGDISITVPQYVLDNVVDGAANTTPIVGRRDSVVFISPRYNDVVSQNGSESTNIINNFLSSFNRSSSYAVVDSGWKYQYDRYNNIYRWIPLNADIAGLCAATDLIADPWYSPAGFNRGRIKNVTKLAWNPSKANRDVLYPKGVNSVCSFVGEGTVLFGDKTLQSKPSAFDRINVRRLFIVLEKAISIAAKYSLFEFNDAFTRAQFVSMVEPYLRDVQGRRGISRFKVVCDETNNTPSIIDRNQFVGTIIVVPARSINFIQLNFVAAPTGVEFDTLIGTGLI